MAGIANEKAPGLIENLNETGGLNGGHDWD
jgi:hypothetical protein